jgi:hypothetical protein
VGKCFTKGSSGMKSQERKNEHWSQSRKKEKKKKKGKGEKKNNERFRGLVMKCSQFG